MLPQQRHRGSQRLGDIRHQLICSAAGAAWLLAPIDHEADAASLCRRASWCMLRPNAATTFRLIADNELFMTIAGETQMTLTVGCFCGHVRYQISAPLRRTRSCHCSRCRKAFSGAGSA
jgi:hypothetical protein